MAELRILYSGGRTVTVELTKPEVVLGRDASCDIMLEDAVTSRRHVLLRRDGSGQYSVEDLKSKNGTTVNDRLITTSPIRPGDRIGVGDCILTLSGLGPQVVLSDPPTETTVGATSAWHMHQQIALPQQRLEKLYELNERLTGKFERDDLLKEVTDICVELLRFERVGACIWRGDSHPPQWVAIRNTRPDASGEFRISRSMVDRALHNGERILVHDAADENADPTLSMVSNHIRSAMCVPMAYHGKVRGALYGDRVSGAAAYTREDIDFFAALGRLASMGLANVQLLEEMRARQQVELQIGWAREIQNRLFPTERLEGAGFQIEALNDPGQQVSGDYFDYFLRPDGAVAVVIADVMGKGIPASLLMANLQAAVHVMLMDDSDLLRAVARLNRLICRNVSDSRFITGIFGLLDPASQRLRYVIAGHPPPYVLQAPNRCEHLPIMSSLPLGIEPDFAYQEGALDLAGGPRTVLFYTDGVPDAQNEREEALGETRFEEILAGSAERAPADLLVRVRTSIKQYTRNHPQTDDITMLALRVS